MKKGNVITISDVAEALGVSKTTVSRAISGKGRIGEATRQKVLAYIEEHDYKPNVIARGLAQSKTFNLCVVMPEVWIGGCRNYIKEHELDIEISVFHSFGNFSRDEKFNAGEYNIIHLPDLSQFDGIILEVTNMLNQKKRQQIIRIIQESGVPAVSLLEKIPGLYHAGPDNYATMEEMVEHSIVAHSCK